MSFQFNPLTSQFDLVNDTNNFSFKKINTDEELNILEDQQMILAGMVQIDGALIVDGELYFLDTEDDTGTDTNNPDNFSYKEIDLNTSITVPLSQQMIVQGPLVLDGGLVLSGELVIDDLSAVDNFSYKIIEEGEGITIPTNQQMLIHAPLHLDGELKIDGELTLLDDYLEETLPPYRINQDDKYTVSEDREMFLSAFLELSGTICINGRLAVGA